MLQRGKCWRWQKEMRKRTLLPTQSKTVYLQGLVIAQGYASQGRTVLVNDFRI